MIARFVGAVTLTAAVLLAAGCLSVDGQDDTEPPTIRFLAPENGATVSGEVEIRLEATDDTGIFLVRLFRDNVLVGQTQVAPYNFGWSTVGLVDADYTLAAEATDLVQNRAFTEITVTVANGGKGAGPGPD